MQYQLVHDGEVIRNAHGGFAAAVGVTNADTDDPARSLAWFGSANIGLDVDTDAVTVQIQLVGRATPFKLTIQRVTAPGRNEPRLVMDLPDIMPRLADGTYVVG